MNGNSSVSLQQTTITHNSWLRCANTQHFSVLTNKTVGANVKAFKDHLKLKEECISILFLSLHTVFVCWCSWRWSMGQYRSAKITSLASLPNTLTYQENERKINKCVNGLNVIAIKKRWQIWPKSGLGLGTVLFFFPLPVLYLVCDTGTWTILLTC